MCVAATENPKYINPVFGNGVLPGAACPQNLTYAEASILLFRRRAYDALGGFSADFRWAMCEDSDLSLRVQQHGWRLAHISMPHQHWRSTSFNGLPGAIKSSILEHNRAALFANWRESLTTGRIGRFEVLRCLERRAWRCAVCLAASARSAWRHSRLHGGKIS